jgi:hypothetical protein
MSTFENPSSIEIGAASEKQKLEMAELQND